jgi:hypothetical protein
MHQPSSSVLAIKSALDDVLISVGLWASSNCTSELTKDANALVTKRKEEGAK